MRINELHNQPVQADTYEASMALNQLLKIGKHAIKIHNMIDDAAEMESWVAKKIDLAGDYVKKVYNYTEGEKAGLYDDGGLTEDAGDQEKMQGLLQWFKNKYDTYRKDFIDDQIENGIRGSQLEQAVENNDELVELENIIDALKSGSMKDAIEEINRAKYEFSGIPGDGDDFMQVIEKLGIPKDTFYFTKDESLEARLEAKLREDAGEGHMSKSTLYHTVKYAIALMDMIKPGDDLEGWVQSKLNKAADYLQGVANYEEYQKLNPYREELDSSLMQKHAGIIQKNIDEILARETSIDDIDTKPGMMRILAKRVNEVEKEIAKEQRKNTDEAHGGQHSTSGRSMTKGEMSKREKIVKGMKKDKAGFKKRYGKDAEAVMYATATKQAMKDDQMSDYAISELGNDLGKINDEITFLQIPKQDKQAMLDALGEVRSILDKHMPQNESGILYRAGVKKYGKAGMKAIQSAAGKGASHQEIGKIKDKHLKDAEDLEEGLKDWARNTAMAGIIVAGLAGVNSISSAIDSSIPAIGAMETALEMAQKSGNDELAKMIEKDLSDSKIRLSSGKDLSFVTDMQEKYAKFMKTEGLTYESKLQVALNQQLK